MKRENEVYFEIWGVQEGVLMRGYRHWVNKKRLIDLMFIMETEPSYVTSCIVVAGHIVQAGVLNAQQLLEVLSDPYGIDPQ